MRTRTVLSNSGFNLISLLIGSGVAVVLMPWLLRRLGEQQFGLWALLGIVITFGTLLDAGLGRGLARVVARRRALGEWSALNDDVNSVVWALAAGGILAAAGTWLIAPVLARWLGVLASQQTQSVMLLRLLALAFPAVALAAALGAILEGEQKMIYTSGAVALNRVLFGVGSVVGVLAGRGVTGVVGAHVVAAWVQLAVIAWAVRRQTPGLRLGSHFVSRSTLIGHWQFSRYVLLTSLVALGFAATNKLILAHGVGLAAVAHYELAAVLAQQLFIVAVAIAQALYPAYAAVHVQGGTATVASLYLRGLRLLVLTIVPLTVGLVILAGPLVQAWTNGSERETVRAIQWLAVAWLVAGLATAASVGLQAVGRPALAAVFSCYNAVVNLLLALVLTSALGYWAVIVANVFAVATSALLTICVFAWLCHIQPGRLLSALSPAVWVWALLLALALAASRAWPGAPSLWRVLLLAAGYMIIYGGGLLILRLLRPEENRWLRQLLGRGATGGVAS